MALTLEFERALQAVVPSVSIPYFDFTLESTFYDAGDFRSSGVFAPSWFGDAAPLNTLRTVTAGRWAFVPTMADARGFSRWTNSYGLLRAPWNNDPTPFSTRSDKVYGYRNNLKPSGCAEYARALAQTSWVGLARQLNSAAHGHIHELIGGSWDHDYSKNMTHDSRLHPAVFTFAHQIQALSKLLWRAGVVECPAACDLSADASQACACTCGTATSASPYATLRDAGVLAAAQFFDADEKLIASFVGEDGTSTEYRLPNYSAAESEEIYAALLAILCVPGHIGDMYQATSTNDVLFWVLHPTLDRLWHYKRLVANSSSFDAAWPHDAAACYGHNPSDKQPFKWLFGDPEPLENVELVRRFDPKSAALAYAYDRFEWTHCRAAGRAVGG